jgi:hypothetical protein
VSAFRGLKKIKMATVAITFGGRKKEKERKKE